MEDPAMSEPGGPLAIPFAQLNLESLAAVGGKNASLGEMIGALGACGVRVPDGFAVTADAFRLHMREGGLEEEVYGALERLDLSDIAALADCGHGAGLRHLGFTDERVAQRSGGLGCPAGQFGCGNSLVGVQALALLLVHHGHWWRRDRGHHLRHLGGYRGEGTLLAWLRGIAVRLAIDWRRGLGRKLKNLVTMHHEDGDLELPAPDRHEARDARLSVTGQTFQAALQLLSARQRACLILHELEDLPFAEVAREVGCAEATARVHHHRATQRMNELLARPADEIGGQQA